MDCENMKKYLFVGGKADGHMIDVPKHYGHWNIPYIEGISDILTEVITEEQVETTQLSINREVYRKIQWRSGDNKFFEFFVLNSIDNENIMEIVMDNYKPKQDAELDNRIKGMKILLEECSSLLKDALDHIITSSLNRRIWDTMLKIFKFININKL